MDAEAETNSSIVQEDVADEPVVAACETSPGRMVFTEEGNSDAWIATDLTVSLDE